MDVGVGSFVECIDDTDLGDREGDGSSVPCRLVQGLIYTVAAVIRAGDIHPVALKPWPADCIDLVEAPMPPHVLLCGDHLGVFWGYNVRRFRPVRKPDPLFLKKLLDQPVPIMGIV